MFDISFSELLVIAVVALVVIGPEKLPKVARTAGAFFGRLQRFVAQVKDEVNREARFAELQKLQEEVHSSLQQNYVDIEQSILPNSSEMTESVEPAPVKKARKPRQTKTTEAEPPLAKPRRRTKATYSAVVEEEAKGDVSKAARRQRKPKPASDTADMFIDDDQS